MIRRPRPKRRSKSTRWIATVLAEGLRPDVEIPSPVSLTRPASGRYYSNLDANEVVANSWNETTDAFSFSANVGRLMQRPGVYTVIIWRDRFGRLQCPKYSLEMSLFVE